MTKDEICEYARDCAQVFCREHKIDEQEQDDYVQEGVLQALELFQRRPAINKSLLSQHVQWELSHYKQRESNAGFGSRYAHSPEHVSLAETVNGAYDEDGEPLTYADTLVYEDPPDGFGDPSDELEHEVDMGRMAKAIQALSSDDQEFVRIALLSELTQEQAAAKLGVDQSTVSRRTEAVVKRLQRIMA